MQQLFEGWRKYTLLSEEQLLLEDRISDVKEKYPRIPKIIDYLIRRDPSANTASPQKYLAWAAKQTEAARQYRAQYTPPGTGLDIAQLESSWVPELADNIEKFHKWNQRLPKFGFSKDINSYKDYEALRDAINKVDEEATQATKRAEEKKGAFSEADILDDTDDYFIVRPLTHKASCYFGKKSHGTQAEWCITRREAGYFDDYTSEGQMFYFVFLKQVDPTNRYKKLAFVLDADSDLDSVWDAPNSSLDNEEIEEAFIQNLLHQGDDEGAWMTYLWAGGDRLADEATKEDIALYLEALERLGIEWDPVPENEQSREDEFKWRNEEIRDKAMEVQNYIMEQLRDHAYQNPAGPTEADYQKIQDEFDQSAEHSHLYFEEYETGKYYYNGGMSFEFNDMEWIDEHADNDDVIEELVREVADDHYVYVDEIEVYNEDARLDFTPDYDESGVDGFKMMADRILEYDSHWQEIYDGVIEKFKEKKLIPAPDLERERQYWPSEEEKKKQLELPLYDAGSDPIKQMADQDLRHHTSIRESKNKKDYRKIKFKISRRK